MKKESILLLSQLISSLEEAGKDLEEAYNTKDKKRFDSSKSAILDFQDKISFLIMQK